MARIETEIGMIALRSIRKTSLGCGEQRAPSSIDLFAQIGDERTAPMA
jgi:hypothetical protein